MATLLDLAKRVESIRDGVTETSNKLKIQAATKMLEYLVKETPVDTTEALSNWQIGIGRPVNSELPPYAKGKGGSTASVSRNAAIHVGTQKLLTAKPGQAVYLSNLVPYIRRLNNGYSKPPGCCFVEAAILIGRNFVKSVKLIRLRK